MHVLTAPCKRFNVSLLAQNAVLDLKLILLLVSGGSAASAHRMKGSPDSLIRRPEDTQRLTLTSITCFRHLDCRVSREGSRREGYLSVGIRPPSQGGVFTLRDDQHSIAKSDKTSDVARQVGPP